MTTGKTTALTRRTFVGKVMSLLFNMLSMLVITFLPRSKCLLISWLQSPSAVAVKCTWSYFRLTMGVLRHNPTLSQGRSVAGIRDKRKEAQWLGEDRPLYHLRINKREIPLLKCRELWGEPEYGSPDNMMLCGWFKNQYKNTTVYKIDNL